MAAMNPHPQPRRTSARLGALSGVSALLLAAMLWTPALAGDHGDRKDHERARQAMTAGQVLPLRTVLERLERGHPGQVLEVELEQDDNQWIYEVKLLQNDGQLVKIKLDARTAAVLSNRNRSGNPHPDRVRPR
jgi:uncharacterized membrane protein YkoI